MTNQSGGADCNLPTLIHPNKTRAGATKQWPR